MSRLVIAASVMALAAASANCANPGQANSMNLVGPSAVIGAGSDATMAKGGNGNGKPSTELPASSIGLVALESTDGVAHFGQDVTFDVATTATTKPWVTLKCYQNGVLVGRESNAMYPVRGIFTLGPTPLWQSGAADCTATLENWDDYSNRGRITELASTQFAVAP